MEEEEGLTTDELHRRQADREEAERAYADDADTDPETATHERRADKAAYLREKLEERAESERKAAEEDS